MSRLRRLVLGDRYFSITCNRRRTRKDLDDDAFEILARVIDAHRQEHGLVLTAWVFLSDHRHAILGVRYPKTLSLVLESIKVASTRRVEVVERAYVSAERPRAPFRLPAVAH